jgi:hypothetical protein
VLIAAALLDEMRALPEKAIANCRESAHGERMPEHVAVATRKNAGLPI